MKFASNLEILHILEINHVVITHSFLITALKIACPVKQFLSSNSAAYRNLKNNTTSSVFLSVTEIYSTCLLLKNFYSGSPFSHLLLLRYSFCHPYFFFSISMHLNLYLSLLLSPFCYSIHLPLKRRQVIVKEENKKKWKLYGLYVEFTYF